MGSRDSYMDLWNNMEMSEKKRLMQQFLTQYGEPFTKDDFITFLAMRYDDLRFALKESNRNPKNTGQLASSRS